MGAGAWCGGEEIGIGLSPLWSSTLRGECSQDMSVCTQPWPVWPINPSRWLAHASATCHMMFQKRQLSPLPSSIHSCSVFNIPIAEISECFIFKQEWIYNKCVTVCDLVSLEIFHWFSCFGHTAPSVVWCPTLYYLKRKSCILSL